MPAFIDSFTIIVREGLEAILIIGAIVAYLAATKHADKVKAVYSWAGVAVIASLLTAFLVEQVFKATEEQLELLEGATMLLAAAVLLYVTNWLLGKMESKKWSEYIREKVGDALTSSSTLALGLVSFLAVYREGFETVLFYKALTISTPDISGVVTGLALGLVVLAALFFLIMKIEAKLPLNIFFGSTSALLFLLSLKFAGNGVHELQEAGIIGETVWNIVPKVKDLGIYPTFETLALQGAMVLFGAALLYLHFRPRKAG